MLVRAETARWREWEMKLIAFTGTKEHTDTKPRKVEEGLGGHLSPGAD